MNKTKVVPVHGHVSKKPTSESRKSSSTSYLHLLQESSSSSDSKKSELLLIEPWHRRDMPSEEDLRDMVDRPTAKIILRQQLVPQSPQEMAANQDVEMTQIEMTKEDHTNVTNLIDESYDK